VCVSRARLVRYALDRAVDPLEGSRPDGAERRFPSAQQSSSNCDSSYGLAPPGHLIRSLRSSNAVGGMPVMAGLGTLADIERGYVATSSGPGRRSGDRWPCGRISVLRILEIGRRSLCARGARRWRRPASSLAGTCTERGFAPWPKLLATISPATYILRGMR
jgi:hypothetical protein